MPTLSGTSLVFTTLAVFVLGVVVGYVFAAMRARVDGGGRAPAELKRDFDDYQARVDAHFVTSNELLGRLTAQYREVYAHMAAGARDLCRDDATRIDDHLALDAPPPAVDTDEASPVALEQMKSGPVGAALAASAADAAVASSGEETGIDALPATGDEGSAVSAAQAESVTRAAVDPPSSVVEVPDAADTDATADSGAAADTRTVSGTSTSDAGAAGAPAEVDEVAAEDTEGSAPAARAA